MLLEAALGHSRSPAKAQSQQLLPSSGPFPGFLYAAFAPGTAQGQLQCWIQVACGQTKTIGRDITPIGYLGKVSAFFLVSVLVKGNRNWPRTGFQEVSGVGHAATP